MKNTIALIVVFIGFTSCKSPQKSEHQLSTAELIANAHGFAQWDNVSRIDFTFSVVLDSTTRNRNWSWHPKSNTVSFFNQDTIIAYERNNMDSTFINTDKRFINDKFWLLVPFQLVWDEGTTISEPIKAMGTMSKEEFNMISVKYSDNGGYTPGDTYHIFFDSNYIIREWAYQSSDTLRPPRSFSFENHKEFGGIKFATVHKVHEREVSIDFPNIEVFVEN